MKSTFFDKTHWYVSKSNDAFFMEVMAANLMVSLKEYIEYSNEFYILYFLIRGSNIVEIDNNKYELAEGDIVFSKINNTLSFTSQDENLVHVAIHFRYNEADAFMFEDLDCIIDEFDSGISIFRFNYEILDFVIHKIKSFLSLDKEMMNIYSYGFLTDLMMNLFLNREHSLYVKRPYIERFENQLNILNIENYINQNFMNSITTEKIAQYFEMSRPYICRYFKQETGITVNEYITKVRIDHAKYLLENTAEKIINIATAVGYQSNSQFNKNFKEMMKITPQEYRDRR